MLILFLRDIPASDIKKLLDESPDIAGLTSSGMILAGLNVPGMETVNRNANYNVFSVNKDGSTKVWKTTNSFIFFLEKED